MWLYIVRHAWAEEADEDRYPDDTQRPLTAEGRKRFAKMVKKLADREFNPQLIVTSPLVRCRQTAEILAEHLEGSPQVAVCEELSPGANLTDVLAWSTQHQAESIAWVGHAPDVGQLTAVLIGAGGGSIRFAKGAIAAIQFDDALAAQYGTLEWLVTAKALGC